MNTNINLKFNIILLMVIVSLSYFMFGELLQSKFSIIDDHHIVAEVGSDGIFTVEDGLNLLKNEKDFQLGEYGRFRPSFQIARTIEMYLFKNNVLHYQVSRLILFMVLMFVFSRIIFSKTDIFSGSIISMILISEGSWSDIFTRIITSEIYAFYGLVIFVPILILLFNYLKFNYKIYSWAKGIVLILYLLSGLLVIGSKENFTFFSIFPLYLIFILSKFPLGVSISIMLPLTIISANLMGYFFLNENVSFQAILGMTIIFIGLAFIYSDSTNHL